MKTKILTAAFISIIAINVGAQTCTGENGDCSTIYAPVPTSGPSTVESRPLPIVLSNKGNQLFLQQYGISFFGVNSSQMYTQSQSAELPYIVGGGHHDGAGEPGQAGFFKDLVSGGLFKCIEMTHGTLCNLSGIILKDIKNIAQTGKARFTVRMSKKIFTALQNGSVPAQSDSIHFQCVNTKECSVEFKVDDFDINSEFAK